MNNLYFLKPKSEDFGQRQIEIKFRIDTLIESYGVQQFLDACQNSKHINKVLLRHILNLVAYYGLGEVGSVIRVLKLDKVSQAS